MSEQNVAQNAVALNIDIDSIPEAPPFTEGQKLLTVKRVEYKASEKHEGSTNIILYCGLENDAYEDDIVTVVAPPAPTMSERGQRFCRDNYLAHVDVLDVRKDEEGYHWEEVTGRSFYANCVLETKGDYTGSPKIKTLLGRG